MLEVNKMSDVMFKSMDLSEAQSNGYFDQCFGAAGITHEQKYYDPMAAWRANDINQAIDKRKEIGQILMEKGLIQKGPSISSTSGGTYTGYGLLPPFVDPSIVDRTVRETPLVRLLPRIAVRGRSYVYNVITAKAGAEFVQEDPSLAEQTDTRTTANATMSFLVAVGRVTDVALASQTIIDLLAEEIRVKTASMNEALENEIINGNTSTNALGFDGLIQSISTNTTDNGGANITIQQIREDINTSFEANGLIDLVVTDGYTFNYIKGRLMDYQRNVERPSPEMSFGIPDAFTLDGALFIKDRYMPTTTSSRRIIYLDTRYVELAVLRDYTFEELAKTTLSRKFVISWFGTLVLNFEASGVMRYGLA
jgi:hypothetical protein